VLQQSGSSVVMVATLGHACLTCLPSSNSVTAQLFFFFFLRAKCYIGLDQATTVLLRKKIQ
jgi:hypothetical protein